MHILLIEDDPELSKSLRQDLEAVGFAVDTAADGETAEYLGACEQYDIAVLDLGLPRMSGLEILKRWRAAKNPLPVIILTARDAWHEKVNGFEAGADDYLGKPFHVEELIARIRALLKRLHGQVQPTLEMFGVKLDEERQLAQVEGIGSVSLTAFEFRLLRCFMLHPGKVLSKAHLSEHVYHCDVDPDSNVIEVYMNRLRRKLGKDLISTRRGQGYIFGEFQ
ncbi:MAG: response regulator transcription factor [Methylococcaceae bacterium]|nr:response regulator transcription factor [Methylococcaceae bacterium]